MYPILSKHKFCPNLMIKFLTKGFISDLRPFVNPTPEKQSLPCAIIDESQMQEGHMYGKNANGHVSFYLLESKRGSFRMHRCCKCHQSLETKGHMHGQKLKGHVSFYLLQCCQCHQSLETKGHRYARKRKVHVSLYLLDRKRGKFRIQR